MTWFPGRRFGCLQRRACDWTCINEASCTPQVGLDTKENDVALGTGQLDLPAILRAAKKAGVLHYYIEDESPNIATQVPQSIAYLKNLED